VTIAPAAAGRALAASLALLVAATGPARAIDRDLYKDLRGRYEGMTLRLRIDLKTPAQAAIPNRIGLDGVGYGRETAPVLFGRMESVFIDRVTSEGGTRLGLTLYRSEEDALRTRALAIPQPGMANPNLGRTMAAFAQLDSTSLVLELKASKKDPLGQLAEIETLLQRVFYFTDPTHDELVEFVRAHAGWSLGRLQSLTGLPADLIRTIQKGDPVPAPAPPPR
jgi:hypothetical protein